MESNGHASTRAVRLRFRNQRARSIEFHLEPWGEVHEMAPDAVLEIVVNGAADDEALEIVETDSAVTFWATTGSTVSLSLNGRDLHEEIETAIAASTRD